MNGDMFTRPIILNSYVNGLKFKDIGSKPCVSASSNTLVSAISLVSSANVAFIEITQK